MNWKIFIITIFVPVSLFAQDYSTNSKRAIKDFEVAMEYFRTKQDFEAEQYLWSAVEKDPEFIEAWYTLAQIFLDRGEGIKATRYYMNGLRVNPDSNPNGFLQVANIEYNYGIYEEAEKHLDQWKSYRINDTRMTALARELEKNLEFSLEAVNHPVPFTPKPMSGAINSELSEYWPSLSVDEKTIFFTVLGPQNKNMEPTRLRLQEDFYYANFKDGHWSMRKNLGPPVNTNSNEGAQSITADGKYIYFTACNRADGHGRMCDLYYSTVLEDGSWSEPVNLGDKINTGHSEKHPSISADGRFLIFTSNRGGGKGDYDLWISKKVGDTWSNPINLGDSINTPGTEQSPFLHPDQKSLYFSSDGWPGLGKGDIFVSRLKEDGSWSTPKNLGYPINTFNEEMGFTVNARGNTAYYATSRANGGDIDIYTFNMPESVRPDPVSYITGRVFNADNMRGIQAEFLLIDLETADTVIRSESNTGEGDYLVPIPGGTSYAFNVSHPGYLFYSDHFQMKGTYSSLEPFRKDIALVPVKPGKSIVLNNIFFDIDAYALRQESKVELDMLVKFLQLNRNVRVEISGHTDNTGSDAYNLELSRNRADSVVQFLIEKGIAEGRLESAGYGSSRPVASNTTEEGRALNRRTEMKVL